jgi:hypothetical protein
MRTSRRTTNLAVAAALGLGSILGLASPALADGPQGTEMVLTLPPHTDPEPVPELPIALPAPDPEIDDKAPVPTPDPEPEAPTDFEQPETLPEPHPQPQPGPQQGDDKAGPADPEPECNPHLATCDVSAGEPECNPIQASCDLTDRPDEPGDGDETDGPSEPEVEVQGQTTDRGALPRTGAGLLVLGAAGGALTGVGAALRRIARR